MTTRYVMNHIWNSVNAFCLCISLTACGGGSRTDETAADQSLSTAEGSLRENIALVPQEVADSAQVTVDEGNLNTLTIAQPDQYITGLEEGAIVHLPASNKNGLPHAFTGSVRHLENGDIQLREATVDEVFSRLKVGIDTRRDTQSIKVIKADGTIISTATATATARAINQSIGEIKPTKSSKTSQPNNISTDSNGLSFEFSVPFTKQVNGQPVNFNLGVSVKNLSYTSKFEFDPEAYPETGGVNEIKAIVSGDVTTKASVTPLAAGKATKIDISKLFSGDNPDLAWDKGVSNLYFKLQGLNKSDRAGLIPLAGIVLSPTTTGIPFKGSPSQAAQKIAIAQGLSVILWIYIDMSGELKFSSNAEILTYSSKPWTYGFSVKRESSRLETSLISNSEQGMVGSRVNSAFKLEQNAGIKIAADVIVGGIRPATIKANLANIKLTVLGESGASLNYHPSFSFTPTLNEWCLQSSYLISIGGSEYRARINYSIGSDWLPIGDEYSKQIKNDAIYTREFGNTLGMLCPVKTQMTVTNVQVGPQINKSCRLNDGSLVSCSLYCTTDTSIGQVRIRSGLLSLEDYSFSNSGKASLDIPDTYDMHAFSYNNKNNYMKINGVEPFEDEPPSFPIKYYTTGLIREWELTADPISGDLTGTLVDRHVNSWSEDSSIAECKTEYDVKSSIDWTINKID